MQSILGILCFDVLGENIRELGSGISSAEETNEYQKARIGLKVVQHQSGQFKRAKANDTLCQWLNMEYE